MRFRPTLETVPAHDPGRLLSLLTGFGGRGLLQPDTFGLGIVVNDTAAILPPMPAQSLARVSG